MHWGFFVVGAIFCWGIYGPMLHMGQTAFGGGPGGSPIRALLWVGIAYFLIGVLIPGFFLTVKQEPGQFVMKGNITSLLAGALGAGGAVCIIFAFRNGGVPNYVMPFVFGGAPLVNVLFTMVMHPPREAPNPIIYLGFVLAAIGAFIVLRYKPS